jgi:drug/metabolite transporter (DMT)-like permease
VTRRGWLLFAAMAVIWGIPYLLIKVAVDEVAPATLVLARTGLGAALLLPVALARGQLRPLRAAWLPLLVYTAVEICGPWLLLGFAEQRLSSSLTGLLVAGVPLVGALLVRFGPERERLGLRRLTGLLIGLAGVGAMLFVVVGYALGPVILTRSLSDLPPLGVVAASLGLAALAYVPAGVVEAPDRWPSGQVVLAVLALAVVCTALAFLVFFQLIAEVGAARSTVITYVNPAVAVLLGVLVLDERFTAATGVGFALILVGSVLATSRRAAPVEPGEPAVPVTEPVRR